MMGSKWWIAVIMISSLILHSLPAEGSGPGPSTKAEELKVSQLKQILDRRGVTCQGCTEKSEFVAKVRETAHLDKGGKGRRGHRMPSNPNDWNQLDDDFRLDLWGLFPHLSPAFLARLITVPDVQATILDTGPIQVAFSAVFSPVFAFMYSYPLIVAAMIPVVLIAVLKLAHKHGKHNDIPFKQYLRFQARLKYKLCLRLVNFSILQMTLFSKMLWHCGEWAKGRSWREMAHISGVLIIWCIFGYAGFGAVFTVLLGFWIIFTNLGKRGAGEGSAYSVFNNFQYLDGELRMEQIEAEMRHQPIRNQGARRQIGNVEHDDEAPTMPTGPLVKLGRNDKVEVLAPGGEKKSIKLKTLQQHLDQGYRQVEDVRYEGIIYRQESGAAGNLGDWSDSD